MPVRSRSGTPVTSLNVSPSNTGLEANLAAVLCYVLGFLSGILFLVRSPYKESPAIRFHAFQSIFFHLAWGVLLLASLIVRAITPPAISLFVNLMAVPAWGSGFFLWLYLMYTAYENERLSLPFIGPIAEKQALR